MQLLVMPIKSIARRIYYKFSDWKYRKRGNDAFFGFDEYKELNTGDKKSQKLRTKLLEKLFII